jgi:predicted amidohydrolase YtcJ
LDSLFDAAESGENREEVLLVAASHAVLKPRLKIIMDAGLRPMAVDTDFTALARIFSRQYRRQGDTQTVRAVLDVGRSGSTLMILRGNQVSFCKRVSTGGVKFDEAVADHLQMDFSAAAELRAARILRSVHGQGNDADPATGEPTGFVTEFAVRGLSAAGHRALVELGLPWASRQRQYERLTSSLDMAIEYGITTVVEPQNSLADLSLFSRARSEGRLRSRLIAALFHPSGTTEAELDEFAKAAHDYADPWLRVGPLKLYIDDVVEPHTAALLEPYVGEPDHRGSTFYPAEQFGELVTRLDARGFQLFVHATGDRGIRTMLDAVEQARQRNGPRDARHQVVHVECLDPADVSRFSDLGVVACMQPRHAAPEIAGPGRDWAEAVGRQRWHKAWPFRSLADAGAVLAFSSDWNVAEMDPLIGIYSAVTRRPLGGGPAWGADETLDLEAAIRAYTLGSAYANFCDDDRGSVTPGKYADLVVLSDDLFRLDPARIPSTRVELVLVGGAVRHEHDRGGSG